MAHLATWEGSWLGRIWAVMVLQSNWTSGSYQRGDGGGWRGWESEKKEGQKKGDRWGEKEQETM